MFTDAALMEGSEGGACPPNSASRVGFMDGPVQQDEVIFSTDTTQSCDLTK